MPNVSWHSPDSVSAFDQALASDLRAAADAALRAHPELLGIWLFGSRARGDCGPRSDVDLLLVVRQASGRMMDRVLDFGELHGGLDAPVDMLVLTADEVAARASEPFFRRLLREARPVASRAGVTLPEPSPAG